MNVSKLQHSKKREHDIVRLHFRFTCQIPPRRYTIRRDKLSKIAEVDFRVSLILGISEMDFLGVKLESRRPVFRSVQRCA